MQTLWQDLRYSARMLLKKPGFTLIAVLTLALGIGANTAIFQLLNAVRLRSLPVRNPEELAEVRIAVPRSRSGDFNGRSPELTNPLWELLQERQQAFDGLIAWSAATFNLAPRGEQRLPPSHLGRRRHAPILRRCCSDDRGRAGYRPTRRVATRRDPARAAAVRRVVAARPGGRRGGGGRTTARVRRLALARVRAAVVVRAAGAVPAAGGGRRRIRPPHGKAFAAREDARHPEALRRLRRHRSVQLSTGPRRGDVVGSAPRGQHRGVQAVTRRSHDGCNTNALYGVAACSISMRRISWIVSGRPCAEWLERTTSSEATPSMCALS